MEPLVGRTLAHYRVVEQLGAGGMGVVYRAWDERLRRDVAIKVLSERLLGDSDSQSRFHREARALSALNHPRIGAIYDLGSDGDLEFLVMEYVEGRSLATIFAEGRRTVDSILDIGVQIAEALEEAHAHGIIHRDLKPANVMVTPRAAVKVLDFGLAGRFGGTGASDTTQSRISETGVFLGTLAYAAPEQLSGGPVDHRVDIYALGCILYEAAVGRRPFTGTDVPSLIHAIVATTPTPPRAAGSPHAPDLERIILKALEKDPKNRYQAATELRVDLESVREGRRPTVTAAWRSRVATRVMGIVAACTLLVGGWSVGSRFLESRALTSIAVLPFENATASDDLEYLSDGITDGLIGTFAEYSEMKRVTARASVFGYKGKAVDPRRVGRDLGVRALLLGKVGRRGDSLEVNAELVDTRDGKRLWGGRYASRGESIERLQRRLAIDVAGRLSGSVAREARAAQRAKPEVSEEAYRLYLKGTHHWNRFTAEDTQKALEYFNRSIAADPTFAPGYLGLAVAYYQMSSLFLPAEEAMPRAEAAAQRALELDPSLGEAHATLGMVRAIYQMKWNESDPIFRRAIELSPGSATVHHYYGITLIIRGRVQEARRELDRAFELDPLSSSVATTAVWPLVLVPPDVRNWEAAEKKLRAVLVQDPTFAPAKSFLGWILAMRGRTEEGLALLEEATRLDPSIAKQGWLGNALGRSGRRESALAIARQIAHEKGGGAKSFGMAQIYAGLGERDSTITWLERGFTEFDESVTLALVLPAFDGVRSDPRFQALRRRAGLVER